MTSNHNYECFNGGCHGMAANDPGLCDRALHFRKDRVRRSPTGLRRAQRPGSFRRKGAAIAGRELRRNGYRYTQFGIK